MRSLKLSTMTTFNSITSLAVKCVMATAIVLGFFFSLQEFACNCSKVVVTSLLQLVICILLEIVLVK